MREIRFRAWDVNRKRMIADVVAGSYLVLDVVTALSNEAYIDVDYLNSDGENIVVMQYTGLKGKNGVEIYEGDVLTELGHIKVVEWSDEGLGWVFSIIREFKNNYSASIEVIGNIYENPELLQELKS